MLLRAGPGAVLPLGSDLVAEDEVGDEPQREEEDAKDNEVQVEFGVQHVQLLQDGLGLLEVTGVVFVAVQIVSVETVDRQDDALETVPETKHRSFNSNLRNSATFPPNDSSSCRNVGGGAGGGASDDQSGICCIG